MASLALEMSQERDREAVSWVEVFETRPEGEVGLIWQHPETCDTWSGALSNGLPAGPGVYIFSKAKLCVEATVIQRPREDDLVFSGQASMTWPDGASYDGELVEQICGILHSTSSNYMVLANLCSALAISGRAAGKMAAGMAPEQCSLGALLYWICPPWRSESVRTPCGKRAYALLWRMAGEQDVREGGC
jgi:hypothetical protein